MREIVNTLIDMQIRLFASGPVVAISFIVVFDCLLVYTASFLLRKKVSQAEVGFVLLATVVVVMVVLEFTGA